MSSLPAPTADPSLARDDTLVGDAAHAEHVALAILEHLPDLVIRHDRDGRLLYANAAAREALGFSGEGPMAGRGGDVLHDGRAAASELVARCAAAATEVAATGAPMAFELRLPGADGARWLECGVRPEPGADGSVAATLTVGRDVTSARRATRALRASEARHRALVEATSQAVWRTGPGGEVDALTAGWRAYTGQQPGHAGGEQWLEAVHPDDRARVVATWRAAVAAERVYDAQYRVRRRDGVWRHVVARGAPVRDDAGRIVEWIGTIDDVTEREEEHARLIEAQRIARLGSWSWDAATGRVRLSEGWAEILGVAEDVAADPETVLQRVLPPESWPEFAAKRERVDRERMPDSEGRWRIVRADGAERVLHTRSRWRFDADGRRVAGSGTLQDITEQVMAETRLVRQQALFEESQRLANVGSWELDLETDAIAWSDQMYRIAGQPPSAGPVTRARLAEMIPVEDQAFVRERLAEGVASGRDVEYEHRMVRPDGSVRLVHTRACMVRGSGGQTTRVVGSTQDVTEHRQLEQQVRQAQKMEALGLLAGSVAHDFNNVLTAIVSGAELARREVGDGTQAAADLDDIREAGLRAADLTRQLLAFSRRQVRRPRVLDLRDIAVHAQRLLRRLLPDDVALELALDAEPCVVVGDASQLEQVLMNLVMNAGDAIAEARAPRDGAAAPRGDPRVTLAVARRTVKAGDGLTSARDGAPLAPGAYVAVAVRDRGVGIDAATLPRVFEPFFTTKPEGKGTGLGLATVFSIVSQHDGAIRVDSAPGDGATFTILLPAVAAPPDADDDAAAAPMRGAETILLVEDEAPVRGLATRILERHGYRVVGACHGADALRVWRDYGPSIDLVLTDLRMPVMDGHALAAALRAERPELPIACMSGYASDVEPEDAAADSASPLLEKPFTSEALLAHVRAALDRRAVR